MTFEEISTKYPVGKLLYRKVEKERRCGFWASEHDKQIFRAKDPDAEFAWNGTVIYHDKMKREYCDKNNIKLIIVNYKRNYDIKYEDLRLEEFE